MTTQTSTTKKEPTEQERKALEQLQTELSKLTTVSAKIRFLDSKGMSRGDIAKFLTIRYQWVRNVLITPVKKPKS